MRASRLTSRIGLAVAVLGLAVGAAGRAVAGSITYIETGVGSGSLGTSSFTNAPFTFTATADTGTITAPDASIFAVPATSATVAVTGIGTATVTDSVVVFDQHAPPSGIPTTAGFAVGTPATFETILLLENSAFASYNLAAPIGPLTGSGVFDKSVETSLGPFALTPSGTTFPGTFQATVPEPSNLVMACIGVALVAAYAWRGPAVARRKMTSSENPSVGGMEC